MLIIDEPTTEKIKRAWMVEVLRGKSPMLLGMAKNKCFIELWCDDGDYLVDPYDTMFFLNEPHLKIGIFHSLDAALDDLEYVFEGVDDFADNAREMCEIATVNETVECLYALTGNLGYVIISPV